MFVVYVFVYTIGCSLLTLGMHMGIHTCLCFWLARSLGSISICWPAIPPIISLLAMMTVIDLAECRGVLGYCGFPPCQWGAIELFYTAIAFCNTPIKFLDTAIEFCNMAIKFCYTGIEFCYMGIKFCCMGIEFCSFCIPNIAANGRPVIEKSSTTLILLSP